MIPQLEVIGSLTVKESQSQTGHLRCSTQVNSQLLRYNRLSDFVSTLPQQGHVLSTAQSSEDTGPVEATSTEGEASALQHVLQASSNDIEDVEAAMLQQAIEVAWR